MNELEWLTCDDPHRLLMHLQGQVNGWKLRRFGVACCQLLDKQFTSDLPRQMIELAERLVEGGTNRDRIREQPQQLVQQVRQECEGAFGPRNWLMHDIEELLRTEQDAVNVACIFLTWLTEGQAFQQTSALLNCVSQRVTRSSVTMAALLRCISGNPFRPVVFADSWRSESSVALANGIYAGRAFDRLPVLADALEEAGCEHPDVLAHCRGPGPHARGCWVVDGVLGKV